MLVHTKPMQFKGRREATTVATATTQKVLASDTTTGALIGIREGVMVTNCDPTANLYVKVVNFGVATPTISTTNFEIQIPATKAQFIAADLSLDVYIRSDSAGSVNYTAAEFQ